MVQELSGNKTTYVAFTECLKVVQCPPARIQIERPGEEWTKMPSIRPQSHMTLWLITIATVFFACPCLARAQVRVGNGVYPASSIERPEDVGVRMHTNYIFYAPSGTVIAAAQPAGETPASLGCVYNIVSN